MEDVELGVEPDPEPAPPVVSPRHTNSIGPGSSPLLSSDAVELAEVVARPASPWRRALAYLIDLVVVGGILSGLASLGALLLTGHMLRGLPLLRALAPHPKPVLAVGAAVVLAYTILFSTRWKGRTLGRLVLGLRLVDGTGRSPGPVRATVRAVLALLSFGAGLVGFWVGLFDRHGQTLHDKLTRTFVVRLGGSRL